MAILSGRYGTAKFDPAGVTPVSLVSINGWKLSLKTDYEDVTCFLDTNRVYVPGMRDVSGTLTGFWNSAGTPIIFAATAATTAGKLELAPNSTEPTFKFSGLAWLDADIDCTLSAPKISSSFRAAGPWVEAP
jgi:hypothetical protein